MAINKSGRDKFTAENILFYIPFYIHYINITSVGTIIYKENVKLHSYLLNDIKSFTIHLSELIKIKESTCTLNTTCSLSTFFFFTCAIHGIQAKFSIKTQ